MTGETEITEYKLVEGFTLRNALPENVKTEDGFELTINIQVTVMLSCISMELLALDMDGIRFVIPTIATKKETQEYIDKMFREYGVIFLVTPMISKIYKRTVAPKWIRKEGVALMRVDEFITHTTTEEWK